MRNCKKLDSADPSRGEHVVFDASREFVLRFPIAFRLLALVKKLVDTVPKIITLSVALGFFSITLPPFSVVHAQEPSLATFNTSTSEAEEGAMASIKVSFSPPFNGVLKYKTSGTAVAGQDYQNTSGSVVVNGTSVDIPISITDDIEIEEEIETIVVEIDYDEDQPPGYEPGSATRHVVYLLDNDALWDGIIQLHGTGIHFRMKVIKGVHGTFGALVTDGFGIIPMRNGTETDWPAQKITLSKTSFLARIQGILAPGSSTLTAADFRRAFVFQADAEQNGHTVEPENLIRGTVIETLEFLNNPQFNRTSSGMFSLVKQSARSDRLLVPLEPSGE